MAEDTMKERISALVDGELDGDDMHRSIRELRNDTEYRECWQQYHMIGDALRNKLPDELNVGFAAGISQAIAGENIPQVESTPFGATDLPHSEKLNEEPVHPVVKPWMGLAVAASVAVMAYVGVGMINIEEQEPRLAAVSAPVTEMIAVASVGATAQTVQGQKWVVAQPAVASKLSPYLYSHRNLTGGASVNAQVISHARLVSGQTIIRGE